MAYKNKRETVVIVYDRNGKFYRYGFDVEKCQSAAEEIKGSIKVISDE